MSAVRDKQSLWLTLNVTIACVIDCVTFLAAAIRILPDPPKEIIDRLDQWAEQLPRYIKLDTTKFSGEELAKCGFDVTKELPQNDLVQGTEQALSAAINE